MTPDQERALDILGKRIIEEVFDRSCEYLQGTISHGMRGRMPDPLHQAYLTLGEESAQILRRFLREAVDQTLAQFLHFLDAHQVPLPIEVESGKTVDVSGVSDDLAAEPYSEVGWIAKYSRFKDGIYMCPHDTRD